MPQLQVGQPAPVVSLIDANSLSVNLQSLWQEKPVLLSFLRHFG